jgi:transcriptional regulator with XRE-family HTH domain
MNETVSKDRGVRGELALFLRTKRRQVLPGSYGFEGRNRRTPGLRREEVAELADVGPTWYTWLEQGRDIRPSTRVLGNIASVLQLNDVETQYIFELAGHEPKAPAFSDDFGPSPSLENVVGEFRSPAFIRNGRYDILVWNRAFGEIFHMNSAAQNFDRNFLCRLLLTEWGTSIMPDFEAFAHQCVADLRMTYARRGAPPAYVALVAYLHAASPMFGAWWSSYDIECLHDVTQRLVDPVAGEIDMRCTHFDMIDRPGLKLVLFSPLPESAEHE